MYRSSFLSSPSPLLQSHLDATLHLTDENNIIDNEEIDENINAMTVMITHSEYHEEQPSHSNTNSVPPHFHQSSSSRSTPSAESICQISQERSETRYFT